MNEAVTRAELIDPALKAAGWGKVEHSRVRREVIAPGRLQGAGQRSKAEVADYVLTYRGHKLAVIEAKRVDLPDTEGVGQAKKYAEKLHVRYTYSTNGKSIYQIDMETGAEGHVSQYPAPEELWNLTFAVQNEWRDRFAEVPFEDKSGMWEARYYQDIAIRKTLEAVSEGQQRILLTLATGTGKTVNLSVHHAIRRPRGSSWQETLDPESRRRSHSKGCNGLGCRMFRFGSLTCTRRSSATCAPCLVDVARS